MSRTSSSIKNLKYAVVGQAIGIAISFFSRMVFVRLLSADYLGLNGLFSNLLSVLSIAELGIGSAIVYSMYKPLAEKDEYKLKALMNVYKKAYTTIGIVIGVVGAVLTPFLKFLIKEMPDIPYIELIYLIFVINSSLSYFFTYKRSIIIADQKRYITTFYRYIFYFLLNISQIIALLLTRNYFLYLGLQLLNTLLENLFISLKANQLYPFIRDMDNEKLDREERNTILKNTKAMVFHKIGSIIVMGTDNILISKFVGVIQVGLYSNYYLIINALNTAFSHIFNSVTASVGNLGATENSEKNKFIFEWIDLLGFCVFAFSSISLLCLFNPFIELWLGKEYLFPVSVVAIIVINFYINGMRRSVITFKDALGLFWYDRYKPLFEGLINLIASIILAKSLGIEGILIGTTISTMTTCFWIEPYVLYKIGFESSVWPYFFKYVYRTILMFIVGIVTWALCEIIPGKTLINFLGRLIVCAIVPSMVFLSIFWRTKEFQYLVCIVRNVVKK